MKQDTKTNQIKKALTDLIIKNVDTVNYRLPSENMLCRMYNVSRITAKNAISQIEQEGLVFRHKGKGTFISSEAKSQLFGYAQIKEVEFVALLLPDLESTFMLNIINGVESRLNDTKLRLVLHCTKYSQKNEERAIQTLLKAGVKGFIIYPVDGQNYNQEILKLIIEDLSVVFVDRALPGLKASTVNSDHYHDVLHATEYLINKGHTKIGVISTHPEGTNTIGERLRGFDSAFEKHKIPVRGYYKLTNLINYDPEWEEKMFEYFTKNKKLTAVICFNSDIYFKALRVLAKLGKSVPDDVSIISYADDYSNMLDIMSIRPVSIQQDTREIGVMAGRLIYDQMVAGHHDIKYIQIASNFIEGNSVKSILPTDQ